MRNASLTTIDTDSKRMSSSTPFAVPLPTEASSSKHSRNFTAIIATTDDDQPLHPLVQYLQVGRR